MEKLIQRFLLYLRAERNASAHTLRAYQHDLYEYLEFLTAKYPGLSAERSHRLPVRDYLSYLHDRAIQRATLLRHIAVLRAFYKYLFREGIIGQTPFTALPMLKKQKRLPRAISESDMSALLELPRRKSDAFSRRDEALLELLYSSGLRVSEACQLNIEDVDLWGATVRVMGKGSRERIVPVGQTALKAIHASLQSRRSGPLFINHRGARLTDRGARMIVARWVGQAALHQHVSPHAFRHSFASHLLVRGCDLRTVQELLGHRNLATTQTYTQVSPEHLKKVYENAHPRA